MHRSLILNFSSIEYIEEDVRRVRISSFFQKGLIFDKKCDIIVE